MFPISSSQHPPKMYKMDDFLIFFDKLKQPYGFFKLTENLRGPKFFGEGKRWQVWEFRVV